MYITYILCSTLLDRFYIGFTSDNMESRLSKHLANHNGFTAKAKDWVVVYQEQFDTKQAAMSREKEIKGWKSKNKIKALIYRSSTG